MCPSPPAPAIEASREAAAERCPVASSYSPRSPAKIGQMRPMVTLLAQIPVSLAGNPKFHGLPSFCSP